MSKESKIEQSEEGSAPARPAEARKPPLLAVTLVRRATNADSSIGVEELCNRIYRGVLMKDEKQDYKEKFWVDEDLQKNCFLLLAKGLSIVWIDDKRYWDWIDEAEEWWTFSFSGEVWVPAAKLLKVCWLELWGTFKTIVLSPKTTYEVAFKVKMGKNSGGLHTPVNLRLTLLDGTSQGRIETLQEKPKEKWIEILVGTFVTTPMNVGKISFSFFGTGGQWKSGLTIKGVDLRPKD